VTIAADDLRQPNEQLADLLRRKILSGELPPGRKLDSARKLADIHHTSPNTVTKAIGILRSEGLVITAGQRGTFVRDPNADDGQHDTASILRRLDRVSSELDELKDRVRRLEQNRPQSGDATE
jgi:DNA-binding GntR family transcriptional regulator